MISKRRLKEIPEGQEERWGRTQEERVKNLHIMVYKKYISRYVVALIAIIVFILNAVFLQDNFAPAAIMTTLCMFLSRGNYK